MLGLYLHVPFCASKCPYCDFYSLAGQTDEDKDRYVQAMLASLHRWSTQLNTTADTVYLGGGTPSLLGAHRLVTLLTAARDAFRVPDTAEITMEANPGDDLDEVLAAFSSVGGNRLSLGVQSVNDKHLHTLGRRHTVLDVDTAVAVTHRAGIENLSFDLMLSTSGQTSADVHAAARRFAEWGARHVSAYLLKIENGTPYAEAPPPLPDEDGAATLYLEAVAALSERGYAQYEISNFAYPGFESRHNLKYWNSQPYLGIGPAAHSFLDGKRLYYPRSLSAFLAGCEPLPEAPDDTVIPESSPEEFVMLRLRLTEGLTETGYRARFGAPMPRAWLEKARALPSHLVITDDVGIRLTPEGFLVSDAILTHIL
ncbi:MAG: radical SAM family heme chaperone HemW [Clostridia bacterium]|nr:radical SAM family heme chaperone HemW [Clostridia bacterium]